MEYNPGRVLRLSTFDHHALTMLLNRYGLHLEMGPENATIAGSYWGDEEAGLVGHTLKARSDTPVHSVLHEACHYICMDKKRRQALDTDAGGDYDEENAVCYLQILLAGAVPGIGRERMFQDMDTWGYSFRLGSAKVWFERDAQDAKEWLLRHGVITSLDEPTFQLRG